MDALQQALRASSNGNGLDSKAVDAAMAACAAQLLQEAVEAEVDHYLRQFRERSDWAGIPPMVRNGHHPGRVFLTNIGPVTIRIPKLRGRPEGTPPFESALLHKYQRRARTGGNGAQWRFLCSLVRADWSTLFSDLLGIGGVRVSDLPGASEVWHCEDNRAILKTPLLASGQWTEIRTKAFPAPTDYRLRESLIDANGRETILAVAARQSDGQWQLVKCRMTERVSGEVWQTLARNLGERGFALAQAA
jgi:hypothetical protein